MTDVGPWHVLEGSNYTFVVANKHAITPLITLDFGHCEKRKKLAKRDAFAIAEALNARDGARCVTMEPTTSPINWTKVADSLFSNGGSVQKHNPVVGDVLLFLSYALRDGLHNAH